MSSLLPKSAYARNVLTLMTGTTFAQAIGIAVAPVLTRMYSPEDFGVLALFVAITSIVGSIANGRYELAIMLPIEDDDAINIAAVGLLIATGLSFILFFPVVFMNDYLVDKLNNHYIGFWLYFVPLVTWLIGVFNVLSYLNNRKKLYKDIAKASIYKSVAQTAVQLCMGVGKSATTGLISGYIVSNLAANIRLGLNVKRVYRLGAINLNSMKRLSFRYMDFPKYSVWASLSNVLSYELLNINIALIYNVTTLGFYSLAQRILGLPAGFIGGAISRVYFQEAMIERNKTGKAVKVFESTTRKLVFFSCVFFIPLYFVLPALFSFSFGEKWRVAGEYSQIILPIFIFRFVSAALSTTNSVFEKQKLSLIWQVMLLILSIGTLLVCGNYQIVFEDFLKIYSLVISLHYLLLYFLLKFVASGRI